MASGTSVNGSLDPWLLAKERYLDGLEPHEKTLFNEATLENLYYGTNTLERDDRNGNSRIVIQKLQPLVEKIEDYGNALDTFANIAPIYLAPIWGSIRVVMAIAKTCGKFYNCIVETLGRIGDILPRFRDYERIFDRQQNQRLTQAISNAYLDIIRLCVDIRKCLQDQKSSSIKRIWKPLSLDGRFEEAVQRFREHRKLVEKEAETCHMIEAAETKALVEAHKKLVETERKAKIRARLLAQLTCHDYTARHRALRKLRYEDSGAWVMQSQEYMDWQNNIGSAILSLYGIPGCGKSVLVSSIYSALMQTSPESTIVAYYCDYADKRTLEPLNILGSMAHALLQRIEIPFNVQTLIEEAYCDGNRVPQLHEVLIIFQSIIETSFESVTVFLDGLDEMKEDDRQHINSCLRELLSIKKVVKIFLSSRNDESQSIDSETTFKYRICLLPERTSTDISGYIRHAVHTLQISRKLVLRNPALEKEILDTLVDGAKGMFLWVRFQLEDLCTAETDAEIRKMLQNLPKDLSETYDRLLGRVMRRQREQLIRRMFEWIICSKRPLRVDEMQEAIAFTIDDESWDESKIPNDMTRLVRACGNLVVIEEETTTLQFAHYTVEQYLLSRPSQIGSQIPFSLLQAEVAAAEMCLAYLCFTDFETQISTCLDDTTTNISALESLVMNNSSIPKHQLANTALRIWSSVRSSRSKASSSKIDYGQHIPKKLPPSAIMREKYRMLAYVTDFWLLHTSRLDPDVNLSSRSGVLFDRLLDKKRLMFEVFPWRTIGLNLNENLLPIAKLGWAIKNDHQLLLLELRSTGVLQQMYEAFEPRFYSDNFSLCIVESLLNELEFFNGVCPDSISNALLWLYARLVDAARFGQHRVFISLGAFLPVKCRRHMRLEAAKYGNSELVKYLLPFFPHRNTMDYRDKQGTLLKLNELELAAFEGHLKTVKLFLKFDSKVPPFAHIHEGVEALRSAIAQSNDSVIDALGTALFSRKYSEEKFAQLQGLISDAFLSASGDGNYALVRYFLGNADFPPDLEGRALIIATDNGHHVIVRLILEYMSKSEVSDASLIFAIATIAESESLASFLRLFEENFPDPIERGGLIQSALFKAAKNVNLKVVKRLLESCVMPGHVLGTIMDAGNLYCDAPAISQAASFGDFRALKTLINGAVQTQNFTFFETCLNATLYFPRVQILPLIEAKSILLAAFGGRDRAVARHMVERLLDLEPGSWTGGSEIGGYEIEAPLLRIAEFCAKEMRIAETLVFAGKLHGDGAETYKYMLLYAAVNCGTPQTVELVLGCYDFESSAFGRYLREKALGFADDDMKQTFYRILDKR